LGRNADRRTGSNRDDDDGVLFAISLFRHIRWPFGEIKAAVTGRVRACYGAWLAGRDPRRDQCFLAAAWGFFCGVAYGGFFGQLYRLHSGEPDPTPIPSEWVAAIKGVGFALGIAALVATLRADRCWTRAG
jgi:hypothetical protein